MTGRKQASQTETKQFAIGLIRVSTDEQAAEDKGGIPAQQAACKKIAEQNNLELKWMIQIEGVSGAAVMRSPGMKDLMRIVQSGQCAGIVLKEESRLMRPEAFGDYSLLGLLEANNVKLFMVDREIDLGTPDGKFWAHVKFGMSGYERTLIRDRMVGGKRAKRSRGEWVAGSNCVPFGFKLVIDDRKFKRLVVDHSSIGKVQRLFKYFIGGTTNYADLARKTGLSLYSIPYMLRNEVYAGVHVVKRVVDPKGNVYNDDGRLRYSRRKLIPVEEQERIQILENPPIAPEVFAAAQLILKSKVESRCRQTRKLDDPFTYRGLLRCAECGRTITTYRRKASNYISALGYATKNNAQEYYVCRGVMGAKGAWDKDAGIHSRSLSAGSCMTRKLQREELEKLLDRVVESYLANKKFFATLMETYANKNNDSDEARETQLHAEIAAAERAISRNQDMYMRERIDLETFDRNDDRLKTEMALAKKELRRLSTSTGTQLSEEKWIEASKIFQTWHKQSPTRKRVLLSTIAPIIEVAGYGGERYRDTVLKVKAFHLNLGDEEPTVVPISVPEVVYNNTVRG
jgi:DNA invertase Pin-like site-specific DNA recombinase